jgi:hypothetical protein
MEQITRIPRPIGTTELGRQFNLTNDNDHYISLKENVIHHYIRNNFSYCGIYMNIETFSQLIKETPISIQRHFISYGKELSKLNDDLTNKDQFRVLLNSALGFCLEDRALAAQQLRLLLDSQGGSYAPFISGEVNKAIKLMMDSNTNTQSLLRSFMGNGGHGFTPFDEDKGSQDQGITVDKAVMILKENNVVPLLADELGREKLAQEYDLENMPEVNALLQVGVDISKEGLTMKDITKLDPKKLKKMEKLGHKNRREIEFEIDMDKDQI